jgi:hypothetical protein
MKATHIQCVVYSDADGIAGTFDLGTDDKVIDLKCVSQLQPNYPLQVGGYLCMDTQSFPIRDGAILHVGKDKVKLVAYDTKKIKRQWKAAIEWYRTMKELNGQIT